MNREARYTAPSGKEAGFAWEVVQRKTELKTGIYTFPGRDGAHIQHQGAGARSFPLGCIFHGRKYMEAADAFEAMLIERGVGELQHPVYGIVKVIPTGAIEREDNPVEHFGESVVTVTFTETIVFEDAGIAPAAAAAMLYKKLDAVSEAAAADFASAIAAADISARQGILANLAKQTQNIAEALRDIAMAGREVFAKWTGVISEILEGVGGIFEGAADIAGLVFDVYGNALTIARQTLHLMKLPATIAVSASEKVKGFSALTVTLINQYRNDPFDIGQMKAAYAAAKLALTGAVAAIAAGAAGGISGGTGTRAEAVEICNQIIDILEKAETFGDQKIDAMNSQNGERFIDAAAETHLALRELVYAGVDIILSASAALPLQKIITLGRDRQVIELCCELYGSEDRLDEFIAHNNFNIDEIELIPMGRKVLYYA
ncbi:MAG: DNA circularization N-terminal domain-containing protein [Spirochaetota bacterium]|jgi:hypothetical protein|nr:DNA circularization N-terminal domain-containing protein [Spirochaetota bacterium]